jgi:hypothetical protein
MLTVMKGIVRTYILLFSPILLLVLGWLSAGNALIERELYRVRSDESTFLALASGRLTASWRCRCAMCAACRKNPSCSKRRSMIDTLAVQFTILMNRNPDYAQVRWLAPDGMELRASIARVSVCGV